MTTLSNELRGGDGNGFNIGVDGNGQLAGGDGVDVLNGGPGIDIIAAMPVMARCLASSDDDQMSGG